MLVPDALSQANLRTWAWNNGFDITKNYKGETISPDMFDFHCTIVYSDGPPKRPIPARTYPIAPMELIIDSLGYIGKNYEYPCLHLVPTDPIMDMRREAVEYYGLTDSWPNFVPHMTLSYNPDATPMLDRVRLPDFRIRVNKAVVTDSGELRRTDPNFLQWLKKRSVIYA